jgi:hypothetical protein
MTAKFCESIGITKADIAQWVGVHRSSLLRISKNSLRASRVGPIVARFIQVWVEVKNEPIQVRNIDPAAELLSIRESILQLQKRKLSLVRNVGKNISRTNQLLLRIKWLARILQDPLVVSNNTITTRLNSLSVESNKELLNQNFVYEEIIELDKRHLDEKIVLLQQIENQLLEKKSKKF